nr:PREDICTED: uncharacterized protein LOC102367200 [Latimeria chalumnae]|eukprot:XP_006012366.1 PREDICTED: uncharacterized protein LOC102367200 [Latimeria chalumnae]
MAEERMEREKEEMAALGGKKATEKAEPLNSTEAGKKVPQADEKESQNPSETGLSTPQNEQTNLPAGKIRIQQTTKNMEEENAGSNGKDITSDPSTEAPMTSLSTVKPILQSQPETKIKSAGPTEETPSTSRQLEMEPFQFIVTKEKKKSKALKEKSPLDWAEIVEKHDEKVASRILRKRQPGKTTPQRGKDGWITISTDPSPVNSAQGSDVLLTCSFTVDDSLVDLKFLSVKWFFNGERLVEHNPHGNYIHVRVKVFVEEFHKGNASLLLMDVKVANGGPYICDILYTPDTESKEVQLEVTAPPKVSILDQEAMKDKEATLKCFVSGFYPESVTVSWLQDSQLLKSCHIPRADKAADGTFRADSILSITPTDRNVKAAFTCRVEHMALLQPLQQEFKLILVDEPNSFITFVQTNMLSSLLGMFAVLTLLFLILWLKERNWSLKH